MPSAHLGGRLALALLRQLGYGFGNETKASSESSPEASSRDGSDSSYGASGGTSGTGSSTVTDKVGVEGMAIAGGGGDRSHPTDGHLITEHSDTEPSPSTTDADAESEQPPSSSTTLPTITSSGHHHGTSNQGSPHFRSHPLGSGSTPSTPSTPPGLVNTKLVVSSTAEYVATALAIAHNPRLRAHHTRLVTVTLIQPNDDNLMSRHTHLFHDNTSSFHMSMKTLYRNLSDIPSDLAPKPYLLVPGFRHILAGLPNLLNNPAHRTRAVEDWRKFLFTAVDKAQQRSKTGLSPGEKQSMGIPAGGRDNRGGGGGGRGNNDQEEHGDGSRDKEDPVSDDGGGEGNSEAVEEEHDNMF